MGTTLKLCSGFDAVKKFQKAGWTVVRQKGSHVMMTGFMPRKPCFVCGIKRHVSNK